MRHNNTCRKLYGTFIALVILSFLLILWGCGNVLSDVEANTRKEISSFSFTAANNAGLSADVTGVIVGTEISVVVPGGTDKTALVATFTTTGASVTVDGKPQLSGTTQNDFTDPVTYRVKAKDGSTQDYEVTVYESGKRFLSFGFPAYGVTGRIDEGNYTIKVVVPMGTNLGALVAEFNTTGVEVTVGAVVQSSGVTANNFSSPVTYTVEAEDGSTQDYVVTVEHAVLMGGSVQGIELDLTASVSTLVSPAKFYSPAGVTVAGTSVFIADSGNHVIRKLDMTTGDVITFAGKAGEPGSTDGSASSARFNHPWGMTTDGTSLYVADKFNSTIRKVVIATGAVSTLAGTAGNIGSNDGTGSAAEFYSPSGITTDGTNLYVADSVNRTIRKIVIATAAVSTLAGTAGSSGSTDGTGSAARFNLPWDITIDGGDLYVTEVENHTIRKIAISSAVVSTFAGSAGTAGSTDDTGTAARFNEPKGITTDGTHLYISDTENHTIRQIVIATAAVTTLAGSAGTSGSSGGTLSEARFNSPHGLWTDGIDFFLVDAFNSCIRRIDIPGDFVTTVAGVPGDWGSEDGVGFSHPSGITTDGTHLYIADFGSATIRKLDPDTLELETLAGYHEIRGFDDGTGSSARFWGPSGITVVDSILYVTDTWEFTIRKVIPATGQVTTFAGSASQGGDTDAIGTSARFFFPRGITSDGAFLYVCDGGNNTIRKVEIATQNVTTFAGTAGTTGHTDAVGTSARFDYPSGITTDGYSLYVTDMNNHTIRKISLATAEVTTLAGSAGNSGSSDGIGSAARFNGPQDVTTDGINLYVSDSGNHSIRKIALSDAEVSTVAGDVGNPGFVDAIGSSARFDLPRGLTTDGFDLFLCDYNNQSVREIE